MDNHLTTVYRVVPGVIESDQEIEISSPVEFASKFFMGQTDQGLSFRTQMGLLIIPPSLVTKCTIDSEGTIVDIEWFE